MELDSAHAVRLLAELIELDRSLQKKRRAWGLVQKQRRAAIARELSLWAMSRQQLSGSGEKRQHPRASLKLRVAMQGGPRPLALDSDTLAVGGLSLSVPFQPRAGDLLHLTLVPPPPVADTTPERDSVGLCTPSGSRADRESRRPDESRSSYCARCCTSISTV